MKTLGDVVLEHLTKKFGNTLAVDDVNLTIEDGESMVLLGPSGCGKTTILRMIAGLEIPTSGEIYIAGKPMKDTPPQKRDTAMVFQSYALYPHMKVFDNIAVPLKIRKVPDVEIKKRVAEVTELLRIGDLLGRKPGQLSGGQRQRVALGRAIVRQPQVFLMDEPLSNLDAKLRLQMRAELRRLHRRLKTTTIYVTHDQEEAMTLGERIAILKNGILQQLAAPDQTYTKPANLFVGTFIGSPSMNTYKGIIKRESDKFMFEGESFSYQLPESAEIEEADNTEVILGIRPEHVQILKNKKSNAIKGTVDVIEEMGREFHVVARLGNETFMTIICRTPLQLDEEIWIQFEEDKLSIFRAKDETNLLVSAPTPK